MINIPIEELKSIVSTLNYVKDLLRNKEPNEIIDNLEDAIIYFDDIISENEMA